MVVDVKLNAGPCAKVIRYVSKCARRLLPLALACAAPAVSAAAALSPDAKVALRLIAQQFDNAGEPFMVIVNVFVEEVWVAMTPALAPDSPRASRVKGQWVRRMLITCADATSMTPPMVSAASEVLCPARIALAISNKPPPPSTSGNR